jgi:hypothetical protein
LGWWSSCNSGAAIALWGKKLSPSSELKGKIEIFADKSPMNVQQALTCAVTKVNDVINNDI